MTNELSDSLRRLNGWSMWSSPDDPDARRRADVRALLEQVQRLTADLAERDKVARERLREIERLHGLMHGLEDHIRQLQHERDSHEPKPNAAPGATRTGEPSSAREGSRPRELLGRHGSWCTCETCLRDRGAAEKSETDCPHPEGQRSMFGFCYACGQPLAQRTTVPQKIGDWQSCYGCRFNFPIVNGQHVEPSGKAYICYNVPKPPQICLIVGCGKAALVAADGAVGGLCEQHNGNVGLKG